MLFLGILAIGFYIHPLYLIYTNKYKYTVAGEEIYAAIFKSKQKKTKSKKVLLGDSVGNQLFRNTTNNDTINSLACNQTISMLGHFILLNNYLNAGNKVDTVYMIFNPYSFRNNLDQVYTFHYFLKPFFVKEYKPLFSKTVYTQIDKIPYSEFCREPYILTSNWAPHYVPPVVKKYPFLSQISVEYLNKIKTLSRQNNFKLIILPTPVSINEKQAIEEIDKNELSNSGLDQEFESYFKNIIYLDSINFIDGLHLKDDKLPYYTGYYKKELMN
jgi:hypothetical protein